jgi:predicted nucleotidyltransferase
VGKCYTINEIRNIAVDVAKEYGVEKVALFGSYARGEQNDTSDIDYVIEKGTIRGLFQFRSFVNALEERFGTHVDVITYNSLKQSPIGGALEDEVVLYAQ